MAKRAPRQKKKGKPIPHAETYDHKEAESLLRPEIGLQAQFKQKKAAVKYQYDPALDPQLQWAGKAERTSFEVPTLPLFIHERLSTKAILETLKGHTRDRQMQMLFADPDLSITDRILKAYQHKDRWVNRMVLGDSLVAMNSLLHYEGLGGQVQMIYMDPPYGVKFGSNFQPFVRKRDVKHNDDQHMTREPEMVQAYRDTWELGIHSYLTYLRDRLLLCRELLTSSGSIFVQISDENLHHVREVMDDVFGAENFIVTFCVKKKGSQKGELIDPINDYILWYAKDEQRCRERFHQLYDNVDFDCELTVMYNYIEMEGGRITTLRDLSKQSGGKANYEADPQKLFQDYPGARLFSSNDLTIGGTRKNQSVLFEFQGKTFDPGISKGTCWKHTARTDDGSPSGMERLAKAGGFSLAASKSGSNVTMTTLGTRPCPTGGMTWAAQQTESMQSRRTPPW